MSFLALESVPEDPTNVIKLNSYPVNEPLGGGGGGVEFFGTGHTTTLQRPLSWNYYLLTSLSVLELYEKR